MPVVSAFVNAVVRDFGNGTMCCRTSRWPCWNHTPLMTRPSLLAWALGIARNQVGLYLRRRRRERLVFDDELIGTLAVAFADEGIASAAPLGHLRDCVKLLEGRARDLCDLRYQRDLKPVEIGARVGMAANSVAKALQRIREQLRECVSRKAAAEGAMS